MNSNSTPLLSFIIPTLNEEKILERTLHSIRKLKAFPYEIIVSDGGSKDQTLSIARRLADKVVVWDKPTRQTIAMGRNAGAAEALGGFLVFIDADVFILNIDKFFKVVLQRFTTDSRLVALTAWRRVLPEYERLADYINFSILSFGMYVMNNILRMPNAYGEFQMVRADAFRKVQGFNEKLVAAEDMDMFIRLSKIGKTRMVVSLTFFDTGRRVHKLGWPRAWALWLGTGIRARWFGKARAEPWEVVR